MFFTFVGDAEFMGWKIDDSDGNVMGIATIKLVDGDNVVVCDRENDRIQVFGLDGEFKEIWDDIQRPMDISMDTDGNYLVSEGQRDNSARISILDKKGGVLSRFDCRGSGHGSWIDSRGDIYLGGVPDAIDKYVRKT